MTNEMATPLPVDSTASTVSPEPTDVLETEAAAAEGIARATTILAIGNITSRVLGFVKEIQLANLFGAGRAVDAFQIAITIPRDLYDLAIYGHTNSALVPVLSEYAARKDKSELWALISALFSLVLLFAGVLVVLLTVFAPNIIALYRGLPRPPLIDHPFTFQTGAFLQKGLGFSPAAFEQTVHLLRLTAPALIFLSLFSVLSGALFALRRFTFPAFGAALFNGAIFISTLILAPYIGIEGVAIGWVIGALAQLALQGVGMRGAKLRLVIGGLLRALRHPGIRKIALLYLPVMLALVVDVLVNRPFSYNIASQTGEGNVATMSWATNLREFPMGLVGTAISLAILPTLARQALSKDLLGDFRDTLGRGVRLALTLIIPASVGMFVLAGPLIGLVFERGAFTAANTADMSIVLRLYMIGIPFAAIDLLLIFAFYARRDSLTPALVGMFSLGCYIVITLILLPTMGFLSLMIADSAKHFIHMVVSLILLRRRLNGLGTQRLPVTVLKVGLATAVMALVTWVLMRSVGTLFPVQGLRERALLLFVPSLLGGAIYFLLASVLKLNEFTLFVETISRRVRRRS